jgi:hypothetical protein
MNDETEFCPCGSEIELHECYECMECDEPCCSMCSEQIGALDKDVEGSYLCRECSNSGRSKVEEDTEW